MNGLFKENNKYNTEREQRSNKYLEQQIIYWLQGKRQKKDKNIGRIVIAFRDIEKAHDTVNREDICRGLKNTCRNVKKNYGKTQKLLKL